MRVTCRPSPPSLTGAIALVTIAFVTIAFVTIVAGCADDGNDAAVGGWSSFPSAPTVPGPASDPEPASGDGDGDAGTDVEPTGVVVPVIALDNSFRPEVVEISVGDEVVWENRGLNEHDVLYVEGDDWGVEVEAFQPGDVYRHVFTEPGEYRYYCSIHGSAEIGMIGTVVVAG